jgi:hypothetical protein
MRHNGVRSLQVICHGCRHEMILNVGQYPGDDATRRADVSGRERTVVWMEITEEGRKAIEE